MGFIKRLDNIILLKEKGVKPFGLTPSSHGAESQNRTGDTRIFSPLLYRLSYLGNPIFGTGEGTAFLLPKRNYNALGSVVKCFFEIYFSKSPGKPSRLMASETSSTGLACLPAFRVLPGPDCNESKSALVGISFLLLSKGLASPPHLAKPCEPPPLARRAS